jgi:hypothetical protein
MLLVVNDRNLNLADTEITEMSVLVQPIPIPKPKCLGIPIPKPIPKPKPKDDNFQYLHCVFDCLFLDMMSFNYFLN